MSENIALEIELIHLTINGTAVSVPKGTTVYTAAKQMGIDIPIFCYQDRMPPFGACRMCLVEVEKMAKLQTSCTLEATEGMVVKTHSPLAVDGREGILEFLLINHPLDCPICDRGGECPLQDQTLKHGPGESRFYEEKRRFKKPIPLGPVLMLDRERCIVCARCTRFGEIIAGDTALQFLERGYKTEVGTPDGGPAKSKFIGNTIMLCPVGALTSKVYRFRARPWDNETTPSTCTLCPMGCSLLIDSRDGEIMRTRSCENKQVNDVWLCDKGWFGYEFATHPNRLLTPLIRKEGELKQASWEEALSLVAGKIREAKPQGKIAGFGGNPLTVEENYLFQKLIREGAGVNHVDHRIGMPIYSLAEEGLPPGMETSFEESEKITHALFLGLDITEEYPVLWLRVKQAINNGAHVAFLGHYAPEVAPHLSEVVLHPPGKELETLRKYLASFSTGVGQKRAIFLGRQYLHSPQRQQILAELQKHGKENPGTALNLLDGKGNSRGARFAGMHPELGPNEAPISQPGKNALQVLETAQATGWDVIYVAGADPATQFPSKLWNEAKAKLGLLVVSELFLTETARQADIVFPAASFVEKGGSFLNTEGRLQKLLPGKILPEGPASDSDIFIRLAEKLSVSYEIIPEFEEALKDQTKALRQSDIKNPEATSPLDSKGKLLATFAPALFDRGVRMKHNSHLVQLAKEPFVRMHPDECRKRDIQDKDRVKIKANGQVIAAKVTFDKQVALETIVLPLGFRQVPVNDLGMHLKNGTPIEITKEEN